MSLVLTSEHFDTLSSMSVVTMRLLGFCRDLALRCCRLMLVLIKRLRDSTEKSLRADLRLKIGKETRDEGRARFDIQAGARSNAQEQISALLSFKDALSTGDMQQSSTGCDRPSKHYIFAAKCAKAFSLIFQDCLKKEAEESHENSKQDLATCISYMRCDAIKWPAWVYFLDVIVV
jgi:hypothetical protein